jgi:gliding motility-associated lipoprotein GldH
MMGTALRNKLLLGLVILMLAACDSGSLYDETLVVDEDGWHANDIKNFEFEIRDTISPLNLWINFRTTTDYPYSNLFIFLHSKYPDGFVAKDTLQFLLTKPNGEWEGENSGTIVENRFLVSRGQFERSGIYQFQIEHAMRDSILPEILDVGFKVELMEVGT